MEWQDLSVKRKGGQSDYSVGLLKEQPAIGHQ